MAIFHLSIKPISRKRGQSVLHKAAYNARTQLADTKEDKKTRNYKKEGPLLFETILLPSEHPDWMTDRNSLWNSIEQLEARKDARLAREIDVALPHELPLESNQSLLINFAQQAFISLGMAADVVIHDATRAGDQRNCHAHILLTTRSVHKDGFSKLKDRSWNDVAKLQEWRKLWTILCNQALQDAGLSEHISHESHSSRGIQQTPSKHVGPTISRMEKRGIKTRRGEFMKKHGSFPVKK